jgi:hypothetical protein
MDLNHVKLSKKLTADLFHNSLINLNIGTTEISEAVSSEKTIEPSMEISTKPWKSLGNNQKNILIVVNFSNAVYLPDHELSFLTGIISACKLTIADVAIINLHNYPEVSYKELIMGFNSKIVFLFGIEPADFGLPMSFPHFQIQPFSNVTYLFSPTLRELENDKILKSKLWGSLKRIFGL